MEEVHNTEVSLLKQSIRELLKNKQEQTEQIEQLRKEDPARERRHSWYDSVKSKAAGLEPGINTEGYAGPGLGLWGSKLLIEENKEDPVMIAQSPAADQDTDGSGDCEQTEKVQSEKSQLSPLPVKTHLQAVDNGHESSRAQAVIKMKQVLKEKNLTARECFKQVDVNCSGAVEVREIGQFF